MKLFLSAANAVLLRGALCFALGSGAGVAIAATADVSNVPPSTMTANQIKPNLMFVLDDSGSMGSEYLPDGISGDSSKACWGYSGHNGVFYNPRLTYRVPPKIGGGSMAAATFTSAMDDGFVSGSSTVDLSVFGNLNNYKASQTTDTCSSGANDCTDSTAGPGADGVKTVVTVSCPRRGSCSRTTIKYQYYYYTKLKSGSTDNCTSTNYDAVASLTNAEKQNYANWYQYYRSRMLMMRSASGLVFDAIDFTRFRVGFSTIGYSGTTNTSKFLDVADFNSGSQKSTFFTLLYGQPPGGSTPLRPALMKAGQYFAKKAKNQTVDPLQYSCQKNYTLLSTDGYWNTAVEPSSYIPTRLDSATTAIGDLDGVSGTPRPKLDVYRAKNSLADIAKYFYDTDLRTTALNNCSGSVSGQNVCTNRDPKPGDTSPVSQNMSTFTLGLGVPGVLNYQSNYATASTGDYHDVVTGAKDWPNPLSSSDGGLADDSSTVTARIDDLWHAAVNSGGQYYSAGNPDELVLGLTDALSKIDAANGASAAAATSTLRPEPGDDAIFLPSYQTETWTGDIAAFRLGFDPNTGAVSLGATPIWNASKTVAAQSSRRIVFFDSSGTDNLKDFNYSNLSSNQKGYFDNLCLSGAFKLTQCSSLTANALNRVTGDNVVNYLRGNKQFEFQNASNDDDKVFRSRLMTVNGASIWTPLGDIVNSSPVYVRLPKFKYTDAGYAEFKAAQTQSPGRLGVVYIGANDGMLHAIRADNGSELWAFVPSKVMSNMYRLADVRYGSSHRYFVDATPVIADVYYNSAWHTILVGGLGAGGNGYYALDVTDPTSPKGLWEFSDNNLGLSFGNPVIGKDKAGNWIVAFTSGYNNTAGDGNGRLYVLNAMTGTPITSPIETFTSSGADVGSTGTPSNLGPINAWVENERDNTIERIYGADMRGNVWRFDYDDKIAPSGKEATLLGVATSPDGAIQPITVPPVLAAWSKGGLSITTVTVGTGRYLGSADLGDKTVQSVYAFKDSLGTASLGSLRNDSRMVKQTMNASHVVPATANVDWATQDGWYIDFNQSEGERVNVEMDLQIGVLTVATTVPTPTPCSPGGTSWLYYFGLQTGALMASESAQVMIVGLGSLVENGGAGNSGAGGASADNTGASSSSSRSKRVVTVSVGSDGSLKRTALPNSTPVSSPPGAVRRTSWRELVN